MYAQKRVGDKNVLLGVVKVATVQHQCDFAVRRRVGSQHAELGGRT